MANRKRSLSGIRVTGRYHIGNYLGAGINYVRLQDEYESFIFVADYHTLTTKPNARDFTDDLYDMVMDLIAIGLDPDRTVIYRQSAIPMVADDRSIGIEADGDQVHHHVVKGVEIGRAHV